MVKIIKAFFFCVCVEVTWPLDPGFHKYPAANAHSQLTIAAYSYRQWMKAKLVIHSMLEKVKFRVTKFLGYN